MALGLPPTFQALGVCTYLSVALTGEVQAVALAGYVGLVWLTYLSDRLAGGAEDLMDSPGAWLQANTIPAALALACAVSLLFNACLAMPALALRAASIGALAAGYFVPLPWIGRIKSCPFVKDLYVAGLVVLGAVWFLGRMPSGTQWLAVSAAVLVIHANTCLYDLKDREADRAAGIHTLANALPRRTLLAVVAASLLVAATLGALGPLPLSAVAASLVHLSACVWLCNHRFGDRVAAGLDSASGLAWQLPVLLTLTQWS